MRSNKFKKRYKEVGSLARRNPKKEIILIGRLHTIIYESAGKNDLYKHKFKGPLPYLLTDGKNFFIKGRRKDLHFNFKRGIIN